MKVWIIFEQMIDDNGPVHIFSSKEKAEVKLAELNADPKKSKYSKYYIDEWEVE